MNRGDRRESVFQDDPDHERFLESLGQYCARTGWRVPALCLMPNHFHLAAEDKKAYQPIRRGWCLGSEALRQTVLGQMAGGVGPEQDGEERRKWDLEKLRIAVRLRQATLATVWCG